MAKSLKKGKITESKKVAKKPTKEDFDPASVGVEIEEDMSADEINKMLGLPSGKAPIVEDEEEEDIKESEEEYGSSDTDKVVEGEDEEEDVKESEAVPDAEGDEATPDADKMKAVVEDEEEELEKDKVTEDSDEDLAKKLDEGEDEEEVKESWKGKKAKKESDGDEEEEVKEEEDCDDEVKENLSKLFEGQQLTSEFKKQVSAIFEATVNKKVKAVKENYRRKAIQLVKEQRVKAKESMIGTIGRYMDHAAKSWFKENRIPVLDRVTLELSEGAIGAIKGFLTTHNVKIPKNPESMTQKLANRNKVLEAQLEKSLSNEMKLQENLTKIVKKQYVGAFAEGLSDTEKDKFVKLAEEVSFTDVKSYRTKLKSIREGLFSDKSAAGKSAEDFASKMLSEGKQQKEASPSADGNSKVARYVQIAEGGQY